MKKFLLGVLLAMSLIASVFAEVEIPMEKRIANFSSGCCVWCSLENLANVHRVTELKGIAEYRHNNYRLRKVWTGSKWFYRNEAAGTSDRVRKEFKRLNITRYKIQEHGDRSTAILKEAVEKNLGCAIGFLNYPGRGDYHMVTLTDLDDKKVVFVENRGKLPRVEKTRQWFNEHWSGYTIILYPNRPPLRRPPIRPKIKMESAK